MKDARSSCSGATYKYHLKPLFYLFLPLLFLLQTISTSSLATEEPTICTQHCSLETIQQGTFITSAIEQYKEYFSFQFLLESLILPEEPNILGKEKVDSNIGVFHSLSNYLSIDILQYFPTVSNILETQIETPVSELSEVPLFVLHHAWKAYCI
ncbi:MAG: hypothetical protein KF706_07595 [Chitinophagales bacterium]|nr:hypothetical protein [Chitinophagales bacterium]